MHGVITQNTYQSQKVKNTFGPLLDAPMSKKYTAFLHQAYFKSTTFGSLLDAQMLFFVACVRDSTPLQNGWGYKDSKDTFCITSAIQDTPSDMFGGQGAGFPKKGAADSIT